MFALNEKNYLDKLYACWIGKNIGGTLGAPFEGRREMLDIKELSVSNNEPTPNDDLDLQLVWLCAMEDVGPKNLTSNRIADYWIDWISPHWNEYGICKTNLRMGLLPPMSGEYDNARWKNSNGAWIRSEIWASMAPGAPDIAMKYAVMDAMVDHGISEGVYAAIFTASLQSLAYIESDIRTLINSALNKIPEDSMTAKTVKLVMDCYDKAMPYRETRNAVVEFNSELGWFQAPGNIGFAIIGLLYGNGDFKKSLIYAANCGDDTDCTAATVGATLGIIGGIKAIPEDWLNVIGDKIITVSINGMYVGRIPKTCEQLVNRVHSLVPSVMKANGVDFTFTDEEDCFSKSESDKFNLQNYSEYLERTPNSYDIDFYPAYTVRVELTDSPVVSVGDIQKVKLTFICKSGVSESRKLLINLLLPNGWKAENYSKSVLVEYPQFCHGIKGIASTEFEIEVGEKISSVNRIYVEITSPTLAYPILVPIIFVG